MLNRRLPLLLVNRNAGRVEDRTAEQVASLLRGRGPVEVVVTSEPDEVEPAIAALDGRMLVIAGGDGTVHDALNRLDRHGRLADVDVALVPLGTANALARGIGLHLEPAAACTVALRGAARRLDVLERDDGRLVVNDVHTGVGVVMQPAVAVAKRVVGPLAYPIVNALTALVTPGWSVQVELDGRVLADGTAPALAVAVGNAPVLGNGTRVWPTALPDDGALDVVVALAGPRLRRLSLGVAAARGRHTARSDVLAERGREVRITGGPGRHNADGELWDDITDVTYRVRPLGWRLMTPSGNAS